MKTLIGILLILDITMMIVSAYIGNRIVFATMLILFVCNCLQMRIEIQLGKIEKFIH